MKLIFFSIVLSFLSSCSMLYRHPALYDSLMVDVNSLPVTEAVDNEKFMVNYINSICDGKADKECEKSLISMLHARLNKAYPGAVAQGMLKTCEAYPVECRSPRFLERMYIDSHNRTVNMFKTDYDGLLAKDEIPIYWRKMVVLAKGGKLPLEAPAPVEVRLVGPQPLHAPQPRTPSTYKTTCQEYWYGSECETVGR